MKNKCIYILTHVDCSTNHDPMPPTTYTTHCIDFETALNFAQTLINKIFRQSYTNQLYEIKPIYHPITHFVCGFGIYGPPNTLLESITITPLTEDKHDGNQRNKT